MKPLSELKPGSIFFDEAWNIFITTNTLTQKVRGFDARLCVNTETGELVSFALITEVHHDQS